MPRTMGQTLANDSPSPLSSSRRSNPGARVSLVLLLAINMFNYIDRYVLAAVEPSIRSSLLHEPETQADPGVHGVSGAKTKTGFLATAFLLSYMITAPIFGWLADRMSRWVLVGIGVMVWSLASGASGLAGTYAALLITRLFVGVGEAGYGPAAPTIISDLYPVERRGAVLSWFYMAIPVGAALGYALGAGMLKIAAHFGAPNEGWRWAFYAVVPPGLVLGLLCFLRKDPPRGRSDRPETGDASADAPPRKARLADYKTLLTTPSYVLDSAGMAAMTFAIGGIAYWMPAYLKERGASKGDFGTATLIFSVLSVVAGVTATLLGGIAGDKLRRRFSGSYFLVSGGGILLSVVFILLMLWSPFPLAWVWIFFALFFLFFNTGPSNSILANVTHPSIRATAFALNILIIHLLGDVPSPPLMGRMRDRFGSWNPAFYLVCGMTAFGGLLWLWGARYLGRDTERAPHRLADAPGFEVLPPSGA